jgi:hypothetical protein
MMWSGGLLTALHFLLAFTPLYDMIIVRLMGPPVEIIEPARLGMKIMLPWTWTIAYRRFNQGVLIRFGYSQAVGIGTAIRLVCNATAMGIAIWVGELPGITVGTLGIAVGVTSEAIYSGIRVQPVLRDRLRPAPPIKPALEWNAFFSFYIPLAMTSLLLLLVQPLGSAALSRMPFALESLAAWPVVNGFLFMFRSLGFAYNEVVVALMDQPGAVSKLQKFMTYLACGITGLLLIVAATPLSNFWFVTVSGLAPDLAEIAKNGLWIGLLWPAAAVLRNWFQGVIVSGNNTRGITEAVVVFLLVVTAILGLGTNLLNITGLYVALVGFSVGTFCQILWLRYRAKPTIREAELRDAMTVTA